MSDMDRLFSYIDESREEVARLQAELTSRVAMGPVLDWQRDRHRAYREEEREYRDALEVFRAARAEAQRTAKAGKAHDADAHAAALADLEEPETPANSMLTSTLT